MQRDTTKQITLLKGLSQKMLDLGIVVDMVHCTPGAKEMIYAVNKSRGDNKRPLVFLTPDSGKLL